MNYGSLNFLQLLMHLMTKNISEWVFVLKIRCVLWQTIINQRLYFSGTIFTFAILILFAIIYNHTEAECWY